MSTKMFTNISKKFKIFKKNSNKFQKVSKKCKKNISKKRR